jgi:hypothetical protein
MNRFVFFAFFYLIAIKTSFSQLYPSEAVILSTTRIVCFRDSVIAGKTIRFTETGTGFYFYFANGSDTIPVIVTNAHVIRECKRGNLRFKLYDNNTGKRFGDLVDLPIDDFESKWIKHPVEDLAILPLNPILDEIQKKFNKNASLFFFSEAYIPSDIELNNLSAIEEVIMVGYPKGLSDDINDLPIVRKGFTATPVYFNYKNQVRFLLDIPIYPGSSGSPVILYNIGSYPTKDGGLNIDSRLKLLGIVVQSSMYTAIGKTTPRDSIPSLEVKTMLPFNVAVVIKASRLLDFKRLLWGNISE